MRDRAGGFNSAMEMFELEDVRCQTVTQQAIQIVTEDGELQWIPKSQIERIKRNERDYEPEPLSEETFTIRMTAWIAKKKGFI